MTPPLMAHHMTKPIASPASSPNLSQRSALSAPPAIRIEESEPSDSSSSTNSSTPIKVFQLPPVNDWVPKGESMFNSSILDSRSPQIYRKTSASANKTASYPQTLQSQNLSQCSRVSWPQSSQSQTVSKVIQQKSLGHDSESDTKQLSRSPKLLRKCTSFDLERSKPFPTRSHITSPSLYRKVLHVEDADNVSDSLDVHESPSSVKTPNDTRFQAEFDKTFKEEVEDEYKMSTPYGVSAANDVNIGTYVDCIAGDRDVTLKGTGQFNKEYNLSNLNESIEYANVTATAIAAVFAMSDTNQQVQSHETQYGKLEKESLRAEPDESSLAGTEQFDDKNLGAKPKKPKLENEVDKNALHQGNISDTYAKQTGSHKNTTPESSSSLLGPSGLKPSKRLSERSSSKTSASSVKSAILTSAAKLKSLGRKSPVTLLSYKSHSVSIPDQTNKHFKTHFKSVVGPDIKPCTKKLHQTESSPTILVCSEKEKGEENSDTQVDISKKPLTSDKPITVVSSVQGLHKSPMSKTAESTLLKSETSPTSSAMAKAKRDRWATTFKAGSDKSAKDSMSKSNKHEKQDAGENQEDKIPSEMQSCTSTGTSKTKDDRLMQVLVGKKYSKEKRTRLRSGKRDSVSSIHSDTSRKSDHFHDCCHSKKTLVRK